jgi:hypothetical protein
MSQTSREDEIATAKANGLVQNEDGKWVKGRECEYCHELTSDAHDCIAGDECITICDACYEHQH